ncbi:alkane 1-monooxygenase [Rhodobacter sp. KR11]|uniref:alkane 1-monooxygenase n=1 Tax=Rhodobacter sp. KR11 TaxID=2974588 RepID=UPI0022232D10|nr:alkane 1-monooxygenase [Rhodobacter sp. KR11]MCW1918998.1 alkane 1-monooxygenase [Rhodobacter sp. KR11]
MSVISAEQMASLKQVAPFWLSLGTLPVALFGMAHGGWAVGLMPLYTWGLYSFLDLVFGENPDNADLQTPEEGLFWYTLVTLIWFPVQFTILLVMLWYVPQSALSWPEKLALFAGQGIMSGTIGIVYAHELMHQSNRLERWLADLLLATVLYSHFRSEHLRVHHLYVGTPRDTVTARYGEGFHAFFARVLRQSPISAWRAEASMLRRKGKSMTSAANPFWLYGALQVGMLMIALWVGGWAGLGLFVFQALVAIWQLEITNYIEHYGLTRRHLGEGRYEHVLPQHSWNANHRASNWLLINLQRHSDHHYKPDRRFPLLQTYGPEDAPQLPYGYPIMGVMALFPRKWRSVMNRRVREWRRQFYPDVVDWTEYNEGRTPSPKGAP